MDAKRQLRSRAEELTRKQRKDILMSILPETEFHKPLRCLFENMQTDYTVAVTHGSDEFGKDLVLYKKDSFVSTVIGVVVKCGNISGKTLGEVDAVNSQIDLVFNKTNARKYKDIVSQSAQAVAHKAVISTSYDELPVNRVLVVLAGKMSGNAKKRLVAELKEDIKKEVEVIDVEKLVDLFTEHYPEVFFQGETISFVHDLIERLEQQGSFLAANVSISDCYIDPYLTSPNSAPDLDSKSFSLIAKGRKKPFTKLKNALSNNSKIYLTGDTGTGKTILLKKLAIDELKKCAGTIVSADKSNMEIRLPLYLSARNLLSASGSEDLLSKFCPIASQGSSLRIGHLLIDGLDEVELDRRSEVISKATSFSDELGCSLIITSRIVETANAGLSQFQQYQLLPFEYSQVVRLYEKVVHDPEMLEVIKDGLTKVLNLITAIPLSLVLLVDIVREHKEVPASITELYDRYMDIALGRFDDKDKSIKVLFDYFAKKRFLSSLSYEAFLSKRKLQISGQEFDEFLNNYADTYRLDREEIPAFVGELERSGVIRVGEVVQFTHRSFLDFFAATHINANPRIVGDFTQYFVDIFFDDLWGDTPFFVIGIKKELEAELIDAVLDFQAPGPSNWMATEKFFVGRLLQAGWHSPTRVKRHGIERAFGLAGAIKEEFIARMNSGKTAKPLIFSDTFLITQSELNFGSAFLKDELVDALEAQLGNENEGDLNVVIPMLFAIRRFLDPEQRHAYAEKVDSFIQKLRMEGRIDPKDEMRALVCVSMFSDQSDSTVRKSIDRRMRRIAGLYKSDLSKVLPESPKGFRKKSKKLPKPK